MSNTMESPSPRITTRELTDALEKYMRSNSHSNDVDERWFCEYLKPIHAIARQVVSGAMTPNNAAQRDAFRASEVRKQIDDKRRELEVLQRDLTNLVG